MAWGQTSPGQYAIHKAATREGLLADLPPAFYRSTDESMPVFGLVPDGRVFFSITNPDTRLFKQQEQAHNQTGRAPDIETHHPVRIGTGQRVG